MTSGCASETLTPRVEERVEDWDIQASGLRVKGQGQGILDRATIRSFKDARLGIGLGKGSGVGGALTCRGAHTTRSTGPCEQDKMHSPGAEHRRPQEP